VTGRLADLGPKLEEKVAAFVREERIPGVAAGVVRGDELVWWWGYGFADVETGRAPDARTLFRIASISKTFTATAIMQLRDEGRLHLDDPAVAFLPELRDAASPFGAIETVTIRRLLSHESGLMGDPPGTRWFHDVYEGSPAVNLAEPARITTAIPPNVQQKYSNLGYQLLGEIVARLAERPFEDVIAERILEPLGLTSTAYPPLPPALRERAAVGYRPRWMSDAFVPADGLDVFAPAEGGLWSSVEDVARWLSAQFPTEDADEGHRTVLADATLAEMQRPRYLEGDAWEEAWCIGWYARRTGDTVWIQHGGGLPGFITNASFRSKERVGVVVLLNGVAEASKLAKELGALALEAVRAEVVPAKVPPSVPEAWADLLGLYAEPTEAILVRFEWRDGKLKLVDDDPPGLWPALVPASEADRFTMEIGFRYSGEPVLFHRTETGAVSGVTIGPFTLQRFEPVASV
jgi:CubicO group peptidase (beta-lactamase class C family)